MKISLLDGLKNERVQTNLCVAFFISLTLFAFGSANLYYTNITEFSFLLSKVWHYFLALALLVCTGTIIILQLFNNKYTKKVTALFFAVGLLFWIQGNIIVWNYGLLDGHVIIWGDYFWNGIVDGVVWVGILAISILKSEPLYKYIRVLCVLLIMVQFVGIMATVYTAPAEPSWKYQNLSQYPKEFYQFSSDKNVLIIIIDTFQSDMFQEIINEDERYRDMFEGFTYYSNTVGGFSTTYPSVTLILSGTYYDNSVPINDFIKNTSLNNSIPVVLKQNGFRTSISEDPTLFYPSHDVFDDITSGPYENSRINHDTNPDDVIFLTELTLFRHIPQPMKMIFFSKPLVPEAGTTNPDLIMYERFKTEVTVGSPDATFKVIHLRGVHSPYTLDENLESRELPSNRVGYKAAAKAELSITDALLTALKDQGMYNNSLIFIVGDHGSRSGTFTSRDTSSNNNPAYFGTVLSKVIGNGIPLMLVKPVNSTGDFSISDAPVTLGDIPKTIADSYGIANTFSGESILDSNSSDERIRLFYEYDWMNDDWSKQYLPTLTEYQITGFSWDPASWKPSYRTFNPGGVQYNPPTPYQPGTIIHFGTGKDTGHYLGSGWSYPEKGWIWTDATRSTIILPMNKTESDLLLNLQFSPFLEKNKLDHQRLNIWVNGHHITNYIISTPGSQTIAVEIEHTVLDENIQILTFELPDAISPYEKGQSGDTRTLGIAVQSFSLTEKNEATVQ